MPTQERPGDREAAYLRMGRYVWVTLGLLLLGYAAIRIAGLVSLVVIPLALALFPAALLWPAAQWLKSRGVPHWLASLLLMLAMAAVAAGVLGLVVPQLRSQLPQLVDAFSRGLEQLQASAGRFAPVNLGSFAEQARQSLASGGGVGAVLAPGLAAAEWVSRFLTGLILMIVVTFFYLKDGRRMWCGVRDLLPARAQSPADEVVRRVWLTLSSYMRGLFLVATIDAVLIGSGLWLLDVPLVIPLTVLTFFGALFPVVGAFVAGLLAVVVALADQGLTTALIVLALVVVVQQLEGNVLEPFIMSEIVALHPVVVLAAITAGALLLGVLGAFLAVPVSASIARAVDYFRGRPMPGEACEPQPV